MGSFKSVGFTTAVSGVNQRSKRQERFQRGTVPTDILIYKGFLSKYCDKQTVQVRLRTLRTIELRPVVLTTTVVADKRRYCLHRMVFGP